jgi:hypothetical protein
MRKKKSTTQAPKKTNSRLDISPEEERAFDERLDRWCDDEKAQAYYQLVHNELQKFEKEHGPQHDPQRHQDLLMLSHDAGPPICRDRTPFDALQAILLAGYVGLPIPPWAFEIFNETIYARLRGEIKSLDSALGFSGTRQGKTTPPMQHNLICQRNEKLCGDVYRWVVLGDSVKSACHRVIKRLLATPNWNGTAFDLNLIKGKSEKIDSYSQRSAMEESLERIYYTWKKDCEREQTIIGKDITLKKIRENLFNNQEAFMALFP